MNSWKKLNDSLLYYMEYNILPNMLAYGLAYSFFNKLSLDCSFSQYFNSVLSMFNIIDIEMKKQFKLVDKILTSKYGVLIINIDPIEIIKIR